MEKNIPLRKCIGCGESKAKSGLIRIVRNAEGDIFTDKTGRAGGRGAYICNNKDCVDRAMKTKGLDRTFKTKVPLTVYEALKKELEAFE